MPKDALLFGPPTMDSLHSTYAVQVDLETNPGLPTQISVDGKLYTAPKQITLAAGQHQFSAISNIPDPNSPGVTFSFQSWLINGVCVSNNATATLTVQASCVVTAQYMLGESGWGAPAQPNSLPNPKGPITPNLILVNPGPKEV